MSVYTEARDNVLIPALREYGAPFELESIARVYDKATDTTSETRATYQGYAIRQMFRSARDPENVPANAEIQLLTGGIPEPRVADEFTIDGETFVVIKVEAIRPGEVAIAYTIWGKK